MDMNKKFCFFFFSSRRRHTRCSRDWSSDVCSSDLAELIRLADVQAKMEREVMGGLRDLAKFEMPKKVVLIARDFTIESGELTPSLKVKRRQVEKNHKDVIDRVYAEADPTAATVEG